MVDVSSRCSILLLLLVVSFSAVAGGAVDSKDLWKEEVTSHLEIDEDAIIQKVPSNTKNKSQPNASSAANINLGDILKELPTPKERIVGGKTVRLGAYPFFAQWMKGCGGSLIHDDLVLTAGHCLAERKDLTFDIYVGGHESGTGYQRTIVDYVRHPRYIFHDDKEYDFLILKLDKPIPNPQVVTLNQNPNYPYGDELFTVIGFGYTHEKGKNTAPYLQEVQVPHITDCSPFYREESVPEHVSFCAGHKDGGRDSCQADSGGALLNPQTNVQVGLVSWGRGCARADSPGVYARVSVAYSWIQHQICQISAMPPAHCVDLRVDVTMDDYPFETEWSILDSYGHEMVVIPRGEIRNRGLTTSVLKVPAGSYRFYMSDEDGICCTYGQGGISIYSGSLHTKQNQILQHSGQFEKELVLSFDLPLHGTADNEQAQPSKPPSNTVDTEATPANPNNQQTPDNPDTTSQITPATPSNQDVVVGSPGSWVTFTPQTPTTEAPMVEISTESTTLRVEIFYDMHPQETGWFLVNADTGEELYSSKYDEDRLIPSNADNAMKLVVREFDNLEPGSYWFLIADSNADGICCKNGEGHIRIVELKWYAATPSVERDRSSYSFVEERVIFHHDGKFASYTESHFQIS